jgi:SAM-dependent methyltransferase
LLTEEFTDTINKLTQRRLANARKPTGRFGRFLIRAMNISHDRLTSWGLSHLAIRKQDTILDIGCGGGGTIFKLARIVTDGKVYGIDFSDESVMVSRMTNNQFVQMGRVRIQQGSVSCLPFSDNMFDLVTAVNTHNYWPDLVTDTQEILRVLKPGGKLAIIGSVYKGGKYDKRNQKYAELVEIAFPSLNELRDIFLSAGYTEAQTFEKYNLSWFCSIGQKPLKPDQESIPTSFQGTTKTTYLQAGGLMIKSDGQKS